VPISIFALTIGILFATKIVGKIQIDPAPEISEEALAKLSKEAPSAFLSCVPVFVPIILIVCKSILKNIEGLGGPVIDTLMFLGEPFVALFIGVFLSLLLPKKLEAEMLSTTGWVGKALASAASIILITGAGGIFGRVLQNSGIAQVMGDALEGFNLGIWLPFLLAAAIKTAQGSSTVALITAASIMAPLMETLGFATGLDKAMVVVAIGAGSAVISHANDSFFWVVTQMTGMDVKTGYRTHSLGTLVLGCSAVSALFVVSLIV